MARILVVGGAGYIGSHMVKMLAVSGHHPVTLDNLSTGHRNAVIAGPFIRGSIDDRPLLQQLFAQYRIDAVMHFAGCISVGESVTDPRKYYENNLTGTLNLLAAMLQAGVTRCIFSSSAAVFGDPRYLPIDEAHPQQAINPYGRSKSFVEEILRDYDRAFGLKSVSLRYFNAAGADPEGELGECHEPETHLIPLVLQTALGQRAALRIFGSDYPTPDGTCIRDYIHVHDLCDAHLRALDHLLAGGDSEAFNLGNGQGFSVREVIETARMVTGRPIRTHTDARRPGDPPRLVADSRKISRLLSWSPRYADLHTILEHAWRLELAHHGRASSRAH